MGIVCELHRASDSLIAQIAADPKNAENFVMQHFAGSEEDADNDNTLTGMDKAWPLHFL